MFYLAKLVQASRVADVAFAKRRCRSRARPWTARGVGRALRRR